ncbi:hypothetical protein NUM3379_21130 [Kineococcus sp. NUM-3379]
MGTRGITVTISVDDDHPATAAELFALADHLTEAAAELLPGSATRLVVRTTPAAPGAEPPAELPPRPAPRLPRRHRRRLDVA